MLIHEVGELVVKDDEHGFYGKRALLVPEVGHDVRVDQLVR